MLVHKNEIYELIIDSIKNKSEDWHLSNFLKRKFRNDKLDVEISIDNILFAILFERSGLELQTITKSNEITYGFFKRVYLYMVLKFYLSEKEKKQNEDKNMFEVSISKSYIRNERIKRLKE